MAALIKIRLCASILVSLLFFPVFAIALDVPEGAVILTVEGKITHANQDGNAVFDRAMLEKLAQHATSTSTPWTEGVIEFEGPLGSALLKAVGATGSVLRVIAINDYMAEVPVDDFFHHPIILAMKADGQYLRVRDKGPLFIIYPFDDDSSLSNEIYYGRSVWQVARIVVE